MSSAALNVRDHYEDGISDGDLLGIEGRADDPPSLYGFDGAGATVEVRVDFYGADPAEALAAFVEHVRSWHHVHAEGVSGARVE